MKLRLTNYDTSEYKQFEDMLNNLSKSGYNCKSVDMFTVFKKDEQRFYYKADIFVPQKKSSKNNREQRDQWLLNYVNHGYEFIGKSRKIYVFKAAQAANIKGTDQALLLTYFKRNKTISNIIFIFVAMLLSFLLIPSVFANQNPMEFITNNAQTSTYYLRNAAFLRLKNAELGYSFFPWLRVYAAGTNLLTFSPFSTWDPEMGSGNGLKYPLQRTAKIGIQFHY